MNEKYARMQADLFDHELKKGKSYERASYYASVVTSSVIKVEQEERLSKESLKKND